MGNAVFESGDPDSGTTAAGMQQGSPVSQPFSALFARDTSGCVCVCVYYGRTYYKAVRVGGGADVAVVISLKLFFGPCG